MILRLAWITWDLVWECAGAAVWRSGWGGNSEQDRLACGGNESAGTRELRLAQIDLWACIPLQRMCISGIVVVCLTTELTTTDVECRFASHPRFRSVVSAVPRRAYHPVPKWVRAEVPIELGVVNIVPAAVLIHQPVLSYAMPVMPLKRGQDQHLDHEPAHPQRREDSDEWRCGKVQRRL
jgi:hypothetical protein